MLFHAPMSLHRLFILIGMPFPFVPTSELLVTLKDPEEIMPPLEGFPNFHVLFSEGT